MPKLLKRLVRDLWVAVTLILVASALLLFSDQGNRPDRRKDPQDNAIPGEDGPARICLITLVENPLLDEAAGGVEDALIESGLQREADYVIKKYSAQGEIGQLAQIVDAVILEKPDAVVTVTTPALIAAGKKIRTIPLVFTVASDPRKLNIFGNEKPANICGVHDDPQVDRLLQMAKKYNNKLEKAGIIYDAAQPNSLISVGKLRLAGREQKIRILEVTASTVTDLEPAARALIQRGAEAFILSADNLVLTGFPAIVRVAQPLSVPIYVTEPGFMDQGATGAIGDNYREWGKQAGKMLEQILKGVPAASLPFEPTRNQIVVEPQ